MSMQITIGADPEVFVRRGGLLESAFGLIKGTKENPFKVNDGAVQVDGMALEFNIDPADSEERFAHNISSVMAQLESMVPEHEVVREPVAHFGLEYINQQPLEARILGCEPDYDAWRDGEVNTPPDVETPFRTAAGHVHVGFTNNVDPLDPIHLDMCCQLAREMDFFLGLPSLLYDKDVERRQMYGRAGCFRPKNYGMEYRTLSNAWLKDEKLISWVFRATQAAVNSLASGRYLHKTYGDIQAIINESLVDEAKNIIEAEGLEVPDV